MSIGPSEQEYEILQQTCNTRDKRSIIEKLYELCFGMWVQLLTSYVKGNQEDSQDFIHSGIVALLVHLPDDEVLDSRHLVGYSTKTILNLANQCKRKQRVRIDHQENVVQYQRATGAVVEFPDLAELLFHQKVLVDINDEIGSLSEDSQMITFYRLSGMKFTEIAEQMDLQANTARNIHHRTKKHIKAFLDRKYLPESIDVALLGRAGELLDEKETQQKSESHRST